MSKELGILTVIGKDRPGIIARVSGLLYHAGCNLEDVSMTQLEEHLAMMMIVCCDETRRKKIESALVKLAKKTGLSFYWKNLPGKLSERRFQRAPQTGSSCLVTAIGRDRTGIVYEVSRLMALFNLNITGLNSQVLGAGKNQLYSMMLEVDLPKNFKFSRLSRPAGALAKKLRVEIQIKPVQRIQC